VESFLRKLPRPFFVLAPMDDVTDTVFRRVIKSCAAPDLFFTEFVNADGVQSAGRKAVSKKLVYHKEEQPLIAQIWGAKPDNFETTAREIMQQGFVGVDLNMGCPVKNVIKQGLCSGLIENRELAHELIAATQKGAGAENVSIKTRIGTKEYDESWMRFLLGHKPVMLAVHWRSVKELSKVPAHWELAEKVIKLRDEISPKTLLVGNGDVMSRKQGEELAEQSGLDGIMIGRGIFHDPYIFAPQSPWAETSADERKQLYLKHINLFNKEWGCNKNQALLKKFAKIYISDFDGAKELRDRLMHTESIEQLRSTLTDRL